MASLPTETIVSETRYPGAYHEVQIGQAVKDHLFLNNQRVGTLNNGSTLFFTIGDHLGSSDIVTDTTGVATEYRDYKPYGTQALSQVTTDSKNTRTFTDKERDTESNLQYYGARYLSNSLARFNAVDPVLLNLQNEQFVKTITGKKLVAFLADPQMLNSYAYSVNNPLRFVDPDGNGIWQTITGKLSNYQIQAGQAAEVLYQTYPVWKTAMDHPYASSAIIGIGGGAAAGIGSVVLGGSIICGVLCGPSGATLTILGAKANEVLSSERGWSLGRVLDSGKNLLQHFEKHGIEVGARGVQEYSRLANDFISKGMYTHTWREGADQVFYNVNNNLINIVNKDNLISSFYKVADPEKLKYIGEIINKLK